MVTNKFIPSTQFIEKLPNICVDLELVSIYDMDCYSVPQLLYKLAQKINDTITNMEHNDTALKTQLDDLKIKLEYLLGEGLTTELQKIIEKMYADGTLQELLGQSLIDIKKDLDRVEEDMENIKNSLGDLNKYKKFKPTFGFNAFGSPACDIYDHSSQVVLIEKFIEIGVKSFAYCIQINQSNDSLSIGEDINLIKQNIAYIKNRDLDIPCIHMYLPHNLQSTSRFASQYPSMISEVLDMFKDIDFKYVVVWNEAAEKLREENSKIATLNALNICKAKGKIGGIALQGYEPFGSINIDILDTCDFIGINTYPLCSTGDEKATILEGINGWKASQIIDKINYINTVYPNKDVLITESGIITAWPALSSPGYWSYSSQQYDGTGKVLKVFYTGLYETLKEANVKHVFGWFPHDFVWSEDCRAEMKKLYSDYH